MSASGVQATSRPHVTFLVNLLFWTAGCTVILLHEARLSLGRHLKKRHHSRDDFEQHSVN